jgi:Cdc6-like AAA superfamily ATPase
LKYFELKPIPIVSVQPYIEEMKQTIAKYFPLNKNGGGVQKYLRNFSLPAARRIREIYREIHGEDFPEEIRKYLEFAQDMPVMMPTMLNDQTIQLLQKKKQIILYGPPGTGKTYDTKRIAVEIMEV